MNSDSALLWICIAFTAALALQVILLAVMAVASLRMRKQVSGFIESLEPLIAKIEPIAETSQGILNDVRKYAAEFSGKTNELLDLTRKQLGRVDEVLAEATARTRTQMDRIEMVMDDTVNRFQETTSLLQDGVVRPLRQLNALTAGIRAAVGFLVGGQRTTVEQATHDEEMFI
jgi:gas vesicle protein